MISWNEPKFEKKEIELVTKVLKSGYVSEGQVTKELEDRLKEILRVKHIIMTTSCTAALRLALEAVRHRYTGSINLVSIPALTFLATENIIKDIGFYVIHSDVDERYLIKEHTGSVFMPVNLLGRAVKDEFIEGIKEMGIPVICDNAGCLGSKVPIGDIGCYSLQGNKIISCGQGGFCATNSDTYARLIRRFKDFGRKEKDEVGCDGLNYKFNDILAAVALGQLEKLEDRKKLLLDQYNIYKKRLEEYGTFIEYLEGEIPLWIEFKPRNNYMYQTRDNFVEKMKELGVVCRKPWKVLNENCKNAKKYTEEFVWLPSGPHLSDKDIEKVIGAVIKSDRR